MADPATDVAVLSMFPPVTEESIVPALFGALGAQAVTLDCVAVGFPRFKLRDDPNAAADGPPSRFRDSHQANGTISPLSNWREGSLGAVRGAHPGRLRRRLSLRPHHAYRGSCRAAGRRHL